MLSDRRRSSAWRAGARALSALAACALLALAAPAQAYDLALDGEALMVEARWLELGVGYVWGDATTQRWGRASHDLTLQGSRVDVGVGRRLVQWPTYRLRVTAQAGAELFWPPEAAVALHGGASMVGEWALRRVDLFLGARLDGATTLQAQSQRRLKSALVTGVGVQVWGVQVWLDGQLGLVSGGAGRGALEVLGGLTLQWDRSCGCGA